MTHETLRAGFLLALLSVGLSTRSGFAVESAAPAPNHQNWQQLLARYTTKSGSSTGVNYAKLKAEPAALDAYLNEVEAFTSERYAKLSEVERLTFLINAYNALTVKLIVDHYPVKSIRDIGGFFKKPWKIDFFRLFGKETHLDHIEHDIIRKDFHEPRIHLALVCAARSCPPLRAFDASHLADELEENSRVFLRDPARNRYDAKEHRLYLSKIFDWYGGDFVKGYGSVKAFVAPRMTDDEVTRKLILSDATEIAWVDYDWNLNDSSK